MTDADERTANGAAPGATPGHGRTYVLIHGAWFGGWVWNPVAKRLRALGHTVYAPSLTGLGDRRHLLKPGINLDTHTDDVLSLVEMEGIERFVLVGWSYGGMVISNVVARLTEKITSVVYVDAFAPARGRSMLSYGNRTSSIDAAIQLAVEGKDFEPLPTSMWKIADPDMVAMIEARISPHPVMTKLQASKALDQRPDIPHTYILARGHTEMSQTFVPFHKMFADDPEADAIIMDAGHVMMLTHPDEVADVLAKVRVNE